jgi:hypothetical protein
VKRLAPEVDNAPMTHIKVKKWEKENVLTKIVEKKAYSADTAMSLEEMQLEFNEKIALQRLVEEKLLIEVTKEEKPYYHLREDLKPKKNYRKAVVLALSIPILVFLLVLLLAALGVIIYAMVTG